MTRNDVTKRIKSGYAYRFDELPQEHLDKNLIMAWLRGTDGSLAEVPKHLIDDDIRRHAVSTSHDDMRTEDYPLKSISMSDTQCYEELVMLALAQSSMNMEYVDHALHSEEFFLRALDVNSQCMMGFLSRWAATKIEWSDALIDAAIIKSSVYMRFFDKSRIKKETVKRLVAEGLVSATEVAGTGFLDAMTELMSEGYWPKKVKKPSSIEGAFVLLLDAHPKVETLCIYYKCFLRTYPMEDVLPLMKSPELQALMLSIYTTEELNPHLRSGLLKGAGRVRGKLLEDGLGL
jgi:hypothetical protein